MRYFLLAAGVVVLLIFPKPLVFGAAAAGAGVLAAVFLRRRLLAHSGTEIAPPDAGFRCPGIHRGAAFLGAERNPGAGRLLPRLRRRVAGGRAPVPAIVLELMAARGLFAVDFSSPPSPALAAHPARWGAWGVAYAGFGGAAIGCSGGCANWVLTLAGNWGASAGRRHPSWRNCKPLAGKSPPWVPSSTGSSMRIMWQG